MAQSLGPNGPPYRAALIENLVNDRVPNLKDFFELNNHAVVVSEKNLEERFYYIAFAFCCGCNFDVIFKAPVVA